MFLRLLIFVLYAFVGLPANAGDTVFSDHMNARLISSVSAIEPEQDSVRAGLHIRLDEGWHTYWRTPGDSGLPLRFDWSRSGNVKEVAVHWPYPQRFDEQGLQTFGYQRAVILPLDIALENPGVPLLLDLTLNALICKEICIPQTLALSLSLDAGEGAPTKDAGLLSLAERKIPAAENTPALKIDTVVAGPEGLVVTAFSQTGFQGADLFIEADDVYMGAPPQIDVNAKDKRAAILKVPVPQGEGSAMQLLSGKAVRLTLTAGGRAVQREINF